MTPPRDANDLLRHLHAPVVETLPGKPAIIIGEAEDGKLKFMFSNASRTEALQILGKVITGTSEKM